MHTLRRAVPAMTGRIFVDRFDSADHLRGKARTYEAVKPAVLEAGRFSVFEATSSYANARLFMSLLRDAEIEEVPMAYPWVGVKRR